MLIDYYYFILHILGSLYRDRNVLFDIL
eukprot:UN01805